MSMLNKKGQILASVVVFVALGLIVISISAVITIINIQNAYKINLSNQALFYAESGAEEAVLNFVRNPSYNGGTISFGLAPVSVSVNNVSCDNNIYNPCKRIVSAVNNYYGFTRKIEVIISLANNKVSIISWKQVL